MLSFVRTFLLLSLSSSLHAGSIYHCIDSHGKKSFQSQPCPSDKTETYSKKEKSSKLKPTQGQQPLLNALKNRASPKELQRILSKVKNNTNRDGTAVRVFEMAKNVEVAYEFCPEPYRSKVGDFLQYYSSEIILGEEVYYRKATRAPNPDEAYAKLKSVIDEINPRSKRALDRLGQASFCKGKLVQLKEFKKVMYLH